MPIDPQQLLTLINMEPRTGVSQNVPALPTFRLGFNLPVNANLVNTDAGLNQFILLIQMDTGAYVPVTSGTIDTLSRTLTFLPASPLQPGAMYQVTLKKSIQSAQGRGMLNDRIWTFSVDAYGHQLTPVQLLSPGDAEGFTNPPQLQFEGVNFPSGQVTYRVQLDPLFTFGPPPIFDTTIVTSGAAVSGVYTVGIGIVLNQRSEYFWRVRAETATLTGDWSETRSFWLGDSINASPDTVQLYDPSPFFRLVTFVPPNGTTNLTAFPSIIGTFSQPLNVSTINNTNVTLFYGPVDGRTDVPTKQDNNATLNVAGDQLLIVPSVPLTTNTRYTVSLLPNIGSASGNILNETLSFYFTSYYQPLYGGLIGVRSRLGGFINNVGDDEILFYLWRASMHVNELLATRVFRVRDRIGFDEVVAYVPPFKTWGQYQYAEIHAAVHIVESYYFDLAQGAGQRTALSVFEHEQHVNILQELRERLHKMRQEMHEMGARFLREITLPRVGMKSQFWNPVREQNPLARDWSFHPRRRF